MRRGLMWLAAGAVALVVAMLLTAPELLDAQLSVLLSTAAVVLAAGIPGVVLMVVIALRRRNQQGIPPS